MNKRDNIEHLLMAIVGAIAVVHGEGIAKIAGIFLLISEGLFSIVMIVRIIFINKTIHALEDCIIMISHLQIKRNHVSFLYQGEELVTKKKAYDSEISVWRHQAGKLIKLLKREEGLLTPECYQYILKHEKEFNSNENEKTGRL